MSVGFLDSGRSLGVDKLRIIIDNYPDLSLTWLVTGEGAMIKEEISKTEVKIIYKSDPKDVEIMQLQRDKIKFLEEKLKQRDIEVLDYAQIAGTPYTANPRQKP